MGEVLDLGIKLDQNMRNAKTNTKYFKIQPESTSQLSQIGPAQPM